MNLLTRLNKVTAKTLFHTESLGSYFEPLIQRVKPAWRTHWFRAQVLSFKPLRDDVLQLELAPQKTWPQAKAGQHVLLTLEINGRLMTRPFSISSAPDQRQTLQPKKRFIRLTIKHTADGAFTSALSRHISAGGFVNLSAPQGEFLFGDSVLNLPARQLWLVAAGSGITPFMAMLHQLALSTHRSKPPLSNAIQSSDHKPSSTIRLVYFAKAGDHLYVDELTVLAQQLPQLNVKLLVRKNGDSLVDALQGCLASSQVLICGPGQFKQDVDNQLDAINHPPQHRQAEYFQAPILPKTDNGEQHIQLTQRGKQTQLTLATNDTLLNGLEQHGISVTFGCRIGVCHQCQCVKKSGVVRNLRTGELSQQGEQLIQLCISQAVTPLELEL
jgi:ferredoxin-NADP reductase